MSKLEGEPQRTAVPEDEIGDRIKEARDALGWTQATLAARCKFADPNREGIGRSVLANYEVGKTKPSAREIRILCEALGVTPNWLLYKQEKPLQATQASLSFMQSKNEIQVVIRLALALLTLKPHEREALGSLLLSLAGREMNDLRLSSLMSMGDMIGDGFVKMLQERYPQLFTEGATIDEVLQRIVATFGDEMNSNMGNRLRFDPETGDVIGGTWLYGPTEKKEA